MWRVYRSAARVWIWIGEYSHTVDETLETFNNAVKLHGDEAQQMTHMRDRVESRGHVSNTASPLVSGQHAC